MRKLVAGGIGCLVVMYALFMAVLGFDMYIVGAYYVLFGWIHFINGGTARINVNWTAVLTGLLCLLALFLGTHRFLRWLYHEMQARDANEPKRDWAVRWTVSGLAIVILMFAAGICSVGATHQVSWLVNSPEPLIYNRRARYHLMQHYRELVESVVWTAQQAPLGDVKRFARQTMNADNTLELIVLEDRDGNFSAAIALPQDKDTQEKLGFCKMARGQKYPEFHPIAKLPEELARRD